MVLIMPSLSLLPLLTTLFSITVLVLYFKERNQRQQLAKTILELQTQPDWATKEGKAVMLSAQKKAQSIIEEADIEALKTSAGADMAAKLIRSQLSAFEEEYQKKFEHNMELLRQDFQKYIGSTEGQYQDFLKQLEQQGSKMSEDVEAAAKAKINQVLFNFEQNLANFLAESEQKSLDAVQLELRSARQLIDTYRQEQLKIIDENVVAVLEQTLSLVVRNKLTLKDELDMVYESLEKAKAEKFFG